MTRRTPRSTLFPYTTLFRSSYEKGMEDYAVLRETCPPTGTIGGTAYALCRGQWWGYDTPETDRKSTRLNSSHGYISYAVFCLKKKTKLLSTESYFALPGTV